MMRRRGRRSGFCPLAGVGPSRWSGGNASRDRSLGSGCVSLLRSSSIPHLNFLRVGLWAQIPARVIKPHCSSTWRRPRGVNRNELLGMENMRTRTHTHTPTCPPTGVKGRSVTVRRSVRSTLSPSLSSGGVCVCEMLWPVFTVFF